MIIRANPLLTERKVVERSWRERLLTWPWRPLRRHKTVEEPSREIWRIRNPITGKSELVCHPVMYDRVRKAVEGQ